MDRAGVGVVGCGRISGQYLTCNDPNVFGGNVYLQRRGG